MLVLDAVEHEDGGYQCWNNYEQEVDIEVIDERFSIDAIKVSGRAIYASHLWVEDIHTQRILKSQ